MTIRNFVFIALTALFLTSCASSTYYQVYKTETSDQLTQKENALIYEDENCRVMYNFWGEGGDVGFQFYNKTNNPISLHLDESFFILNDVAYDYFRDRVVTHSKSSETSASSTLTAWNLLQTNMGAQGNSVENTATSGESVAFQEENIITIPAKTSKIITEYNVNNRVLRDCDLIRYPNKRQIKAITFNAATSPLQFSNRIAYSVKDSDELVRLENSFYVSEVSNYPEKEMISTENEEFCGEKSRVQSRSFNNVAPNKFYLKYSKDKTQTLKH